MPDVNEIVNSFSAGELSPKLYGRTDLGLYNHSAKTIKNMIVLPQGGAERRAGTRWVAEVKDSSKKVRLIPFKQATDTAYVIEIGDDYMRFYKDQAPVLESTTAITGATAANPVVLTITAHGYLDGDHIEVESVAGMTELNGKRYTVANKTANTLELSGVDGSAYTAYSSAGTAARVYTLTSPYQDTELYDIQYAQDGATMYLVHGTYAMRKLTRTGDTAWTLTTPTLTDGPYRLENKTTTTLTPSATTGAGITITASAAAFDANDTTGAGGTGAVDRLVRIKHGATWGYATIVGYTDTTHVTADVNTDFGASTASTEWRLGAWSTTTGFPSCVSFFEQRLCAAGTTSDQQTFWASLVGYPEDYTPGANDSDPIDVVLTDLELNKCNWIATIERTLFSGTSDAEWTHSGDITPSSPNIRPLSHEGSSLITPIRANRSLIFVDLSGLRCFEIRFNGEINAFVVEEVSYHAEHITTGGILDMAFQKSPTRTCWLIRTDGKLLSLTYEKKQGVIGWALHDTGATGLFESVTVIPDSANISEVWVSVKRTVDGNTKRYVERLVPDDNTDCNVSYSGVGITSLTGLDHLEGETLKVKADSAVIADKTVASGAITLGATYTAVEAGLQFEHHLQTMVPETGTTRGSAMGQKRRTNAVVLRLRDTIGGTVNDDEIEVPGVFEYMDTAPVAFTGDILIHPNTAWSRDGEIDIKGTDPYNFAITALVLGLQVNEV